MSFSLQLQHEISVISLTWICYDSHLKKGKSSSDEDSAIVANLPLCAVAIVVVSKACSWGASALRPPGAPGRPPPAPLPSAERLSSGVLGVELDGGSGAERAGGGGGGLRQLSRACTPGLGTLGTHVKAEAEAA